MQDIIKDLFIENDKKIVLLVMDGVGGLPRERGGKTEKEKTLSRTNCCGCCCGNSRSDTAAHKKEKRAGASTEIQDLF